VAFETLLWKSVVLTSVALILRDIAGIGSAPHSGPVFDGLYCNHGKGIFKKHLASASFAFRDSN
jgi:hypothetical protein